MTPSLFIFEQTYNITWGAYGLWNLKIARLNGNRLSCVSTIGRPTTRSTGDLVKIDVHAVYILLPDEVIGGSRRRSLCMNGRRLVTNMIITQKNIRNISKMSSRLKRVMK